MKLTLSPLRPGSGKTLCYADVDLDGAVSILGVTLYQDANGEIKLGMPLKQSKDGKWSPTVRCSDAAARSLRNRLHKAFLESPLSQPGSAPSAGAEDDPFA